MARLLHEAGCSLQGNAETVESRKHPDREAQFCHLNDQVAAALTAGQSVVSVVSVDRKKKELVGNLKNVGKEWRPSGNPVKVNVHDFPDKELGKAIPYGVNDIGANSGRVNVGTDHDTAAFALNTLRTWWNGRGRAACPQATTLTITADSGGSNGHRLWAWKTGLAALAAETGLSITVPHLPPGTSTWKRGDHRLFSAITMNGRGTPPTSHEAIVSLIGATTTGTGLTVDTFLDNGGHPTGIEISDKAMRTLPLTRREPHGQWNHTNSPPVDTPELADVALSPWLGRSRAALLRQSPRRAWS